MVLFSTYILLLISLGLRTAAAQEFNLRQLPQDAGLRNLAIQSFVVDNSGDMWLTTDGGLYRFDGSVFTMYDQSYGLPQDSAQALAISPSGRIYVRTDEGIFAGNVHNFSVVQTTTGRIHSDLYTPLLAPSDHQLLYLRNHQLYELDRAGAGHWEEHAMFTPAQMNAQPRLRNLFGLLQDKDGTLWFGCGDGLCHLRGAQIEFWSANLGVPAGEYSSLVQDADGRLWARSERHLVVHERGAARFMVRDPPHPIIASTRYLTLLGLDPRRRVITRTQNGLAILTDTRWQEYGPDNGLPDHPITQAVVDHEGNFWLGVQGIGIYRWSGYGNLESWTQKQGLTHDSVWSVLRDSQHHLILGTNAGCRMLDEVAKRVIPCPWAGLPAEQTSASAMDPQGDYWLSYQTEQLWLVPAGTSKAKRVTTAPPRFRTNHIVFDHSGKGFMGTWNSGLATVNTRTLAMTFQQPANEVRVDDIDRAADGSLWMATDAGLYVLRDGHFTLLPTPLDGENIRPDTVTAAPDGDVWASRTGSPILHVIGASGAHPHIEWLKPEPSTLSVYSLRPDHRGWIWANAGNGIGFYDGHAWRLISTDDGLIWNDTNQGAFYDDDDGSVWVGTSGGLTHIKDPERWLRDTSKPVLLTIAQARFGSADLLSTAHPSLPWQGDTALDVIFSSRAFDHAPHTELRYRLLGLSSQWATTEAFSIHIPTLPPGHYELEAIALDSAHARTSTTHHLGFDITPPWWQTGLFHAAAALAGIGALVLVTITLLRRQKRQFKEHEQKRREHERLLERATRDGLTGVWNRSTALELLSGEIEAARRCHTPLAVALADIDHFKLVNDTHGHAGGDEVLRQFAQRLRNSLQQHHIIGRYGGEEFLIVMPGVPPKDCGHLLESVRRAIARLPFTFGDVQLQVTTSIGAAWMDATSESATDLIRRADQALYEAKASGRNCVMYHLEGTGNPTAHSATTSRRHLQELLDRLQCESRAK